MHSLSWDLIGFIVLTIVAPCAMCLMVILCHREDR